MTEIMTLEEYIEHLQYFCNLYELSDDTGDQAEEIEIYKQLILWLQELKRYRDSNKMVKRIKRKKTE